MLWWEPFHFDATADYGKLHGDQNVITRELWPHRIGLFDNSMIHSYKYHPGDVAPIMVFHGKPKPHEVSDEWVIKHWR